MVNREELAWAAGFFDGEGNVRSRNEPQTPILMVQIGQRHSAFVLHRFHKAVGVGTVGQYTSTKRGLTHYYRVYGFEKVQTVMAMLWPFLSEVKKAQYVGALTHWQTRRS